MKLFNKILTVLVLLIVQYSCTEVIDVSVPNGGDRLVVDASMLWEKGTTGNTQTIKLSTSTEFFNQNEDNKVTGAEVVVTNNNAGTRFLFEDQNNGDYICSNFIPVINDTYSLEITHNNGTYVANETFTPVVSIDGVVQTVSTFFGEEEIELEVEFYDPAEIKNYYLLESRIEANPLVSFEVESDRFSDGNKMSILLESQGVFTPGDLVNISLQGISERYYNYMDILVDQSQADGSPFQSPPVQLQGNCKNQDDNTEEVLGYFRLSEVDKVVYEVQAIETE